MNGLFERLKLIETNEKELTKMTRDTGLSYGRFRTYCFKAQEAEYRLKRLHDDKNIKLSLFK